MGTSVKIAIVLIVLVIVASLAQGKPEVSINCNTNGNSGSCKIENKGGAAGNLETDVVLVCRDGEHIAHVSARVEANSHVTKIIDGFAPRVGILSSCAGLDYRNLSVK